MHKQPADRSAYPEWFEEVQANILKPHGREHTWCHFIRFHSSPLSIRSWISRFAGQATSADRQQKESDKRQEDPGSDGGAVVGVFLSAKGLRTLGFPTSQMPADLSFRLGMSNGQVNAGLQDPVSGKWEENYRKHIDGMILLADDQEARLANRSREVETALEGVGRIVFTEKGRKLYAPGNQVNIEHFGFHDSISQPEFFDSNRALIPRHCEIALIGEGEYQYGSYLVFRKLEQNVKAFNRKIKRLAKQLGIPEQTEFVAAQVIGRFRDGTPLTLSETPQNNPANDFDFTGDDQGRKCPFHAHIRKCNPRQPSPSGDIRIVRRGIPYGARKADLSDEPETGVGLLFISYQASITAQFEYICKNWCNQPDYPDFDLGIDPLIGHQIIGNQAQPWNKQWNIDRHKKVSFSLRDAVRLKGGDYFFAPAISWLKNVEEKYLQAKEAAEELANGAQARGIAGGAIPSSYSGNRSGFYLGGGIGGRYG